MNKAYIFVFGSTSTIALSIFLFVLLPRIQVAAVDREAISAQAPYTAAELRGRNVYIENGCVYCHSQQVRDPVAGADKYFGWGRASLPSDYIYDKPHLLGTMRTGPDLSNIGSRQPSRDWHHLHLYNPRGLVNWSIMPGFSFLYRVATSPESPVEGAIRLPGATDQWIIPSPAAEDLVSYLKSLKRDRDPVKASEVKNEKKDPTEGASTKFINVPIILISIFVGFGISYLALSTPTTALSPGDSRTTQATEAPNAGELKKDVTDLSAVMEKGKQVFTTTCQACHQANGAGIPGAFPPLAESEWVNGPPKRFAAIILHGIQGDITVKGQKFHGVMPTFAEQLKHEEIAAVATYVRGSFGNKSGPVSVDLLKEVQEQTKAKSGSWGGESELNAQKWD